jgi:hypothetical protein
MSARPLLLTLALVLAVTAGTSSQVRTDLPQNIPGYPTVAQVRVVNGPADEAVPVAIRPGAPLTVTVTSTPPVTFAAATVLATREARQQWEYRQLAVGTGQNVEAALNAAGAEGWEAIAVVSPAGTTQWMMKRPRVAP